MSRETTHILVPNLRKRAPYADRTACGIDLNAQSHNVPAMWPDEPLPLPDKWAPSGYRWCSKCKASRPASSGGKR